MLEYRYLEGRKRKKLQVKSKIVAVKISITILRF